MGSGALNGAPTTVPHLLAKTRETARYGYTINCTEH
jgi:hypothetical protein